MKLALVLIAIFALILGFFVYKDRHTPAISTEYSLSSIEIATTSQAQARGLGGRTAIPDDYGMLFVFQKSGYYGFWMKDMLVPIDLVWLSDSGTIVGVVPSLATSTYPQAFVPPVPVRYVLETRSGEVSAKGWKVGTMLSLPL